MDDHERVEKCIQDFSLKTQGKILLERQGVNGRITLKLNLKKSNVEVLVFTWLRIGSSGGLL
jgi:hypothetical protein